MADAAIPHTFDWSRFRECPACGADTGYPCVRDSGEELTGSHHEARETLPLLNVTPPSLALADPRRLLSTDDVRALVGVLQPLAVVAWLTMWSSTSDGTRTSMVNELQRLWRVARMD